MKTLLLFAFSFASLAPMAQTTGLSSAFDQFQNETPYTSIYLVFNQPKYAPGDTAYFAAFFQYENGPPIAGRQLLNLDVIDGNGKSMLNFVFRVDGGVGHNQIILPESISPGYYSVLVYSSQMLNFTPVPFCKISFPIVDNNQISPLPYDTLTIYTAMSSLVADILNDVYIQSGANQQIGIIDDRGVKVCDHKTGESGQAKIAFVPKQGARYKVIAGTESVDLPSVSRVGLTFSIKEISEKRIHIWLRSNSGMSPARVVIIAGRTLIKDWRVGPGTIDEELFLDPMNFPTGRMNITVLDDESNILCTQDFFNPLFRSPIVQTVLDKDLYSPREVVNLKVVFPDSGQTVQGHFAISLVNSPVFDPADCFFSYRTDCSGPIMPDSILYRHFEYTYAMNTRSVPWQMLNKGQHSQALFDFTTVFQTSGTVYDALTGTRVPDNTRILLYFQQSQIRYETFTSQGLIRLTLPDAIDFDELFYFAETPDGKPTKVIVTWNHNTKPIFPKTGSALINKDRDPYADFAMKRRSIANSYRQIPKHYQKGNGGYVQGGTASFEDEIASADRVMYPEEFHAFKTMSELIKEVVPGLYHRRSGNKSIVRVLLSGEMVQQGDPIYVLDGFVTSDTEYFLSLKPSSIKRIGIIRDSRKLQPLGQMGKNGIVLVESKNGELATHLSRKENVIRSTQAPLDFPRIRLEETTLPEFRSTIYWNPYVKFSSDQPANLRISLSDDIGDFHLVIRGFTEQGLPFVAVRPLTVALPRSHGKN